MDVPHLARVLIVAANDGLRGSLHGAIEAAGHDVVEAADALVALHAYQSVPADVVIVDVEAPGRLAAPDFLRRLRGVFPDARVITLAGRPSFRGSDTLAVTHGLGAVRALRMPATREQLLKAVDEARTTRLN